MAVKDYQSLTEFIKTTKFTCGYELVVLFAAMKLKNAEGGFEKEQLAAFFTEFYRIRKSHNIALKKECDPLQSDDPREILLLLNSSPIAHLLRVGILKTFERFNYDLFKAIFDKAEEALATVRDQIITFYSESPGNSKKTLEDIVSKWENAINEYIKTDALQKMAGSIEKINLEFMLKYLYQSYSLTAFNKFLKSFQINEQDFQKFFTGRLDDASKFFMTIPPGEEEPAILKAEPQTEKPPASRLQDLTSFFQKMVDEDEKELAKEKPKKKPNK